MLQTAGPRHIKQEEREFQVDKKRKKRIRRLITLGVVIILLVAGYLAINDPPMENKTITNPRKYMKVNSYVAGWLDSNDPMDQFPQKIPENCEVEYCYHYQCGLGYPDFYIYLKLHFEDDDGFEEEKARLAQTTPYQILQEGNISYILMDDLFAFDRYMGDWKSESLGVLFRVTVVDESTNTVEHMYALINNFGFGPDEIMHIAEPVWELLNQ